MKKSTSAFIGWAILFVPTIIGGIYLNNKWAWIILVIWILIITFSAFKLVDE